MSDEPKKLFCVSVTVDLHVVADDDYDAEQVALDNAWEEMNNNTATAIARARPVQALPSLRADARGSLPWGGDGKTTCVEYLSAMLAARSTPSGPPEGEK